jgi:hypothetical protein
VEWVGGGWVGGGGGGTGWGGESAATARYGEQLPWLLRAVVMALCACVRVCVCLALHTHCVRPSTRQVVGYVAMAVVVANGALVGLKTVKPELAQTITGTRLYQTCSLHVERVALRVPSATLACSRWLCVKLIRDGHRLVIP